MYQIFDKKRCGEYNYYSFILSYKIMSEFLEHAKYEKADASDQKEQVEETLLAEIKKQVTDIQLDSIDKMTKDQLATFMEKEFQTTDGKWLTYTKMKDKWSFYAFALEAAMDFISDKLSDKKYTEEWVEDVKTDGTWWWKTLDERLQEYWGVDATDDEKNTKIVILLQKIMGISADGYAGPETMANITALLKWTTLESIQVDWYDENNPYGYNKVSSLLQNRNNEARGEKNESVTKNTIEEKITAYNAEGVTEEIKTKLVNELETELAKQITNYTGAWFHKNLATAILTKQNSFTWNSLTFYPIIATDGTISITDSDDEAEKKRNEVETTKKEAERLAKAKEYSEKIFPESLTIAQMGDTYYIVMPEFKAPLLPIDTPAVIAKIPFSSKENAQSFIDISKKFIQTYGYKIDKNGSNYYKKVQYLSAKEVYLESVYKLMKENENWIAWIKKESEMRASLSIGIDNLDCWTKESVA